MKYSFNINQVAAAELGDIDVVDCIIIDWVRDMCIAQSPAIKRERRNGYTWISYQHATNDLPLLGFSDKSAFRHRLAKLVQKGYFKAQKIDQRAYVKPTAKVDKLYTQPGNEIPGPGNAVPTPPARKTEVNRGTVSPNPNPVTKSLGKHQKTGDKSQSRGEPSPAKERLRQQLAAKGILKRRQVDIVRHEENEGRQVEAVNHTYLSDKPVKRAVKHARGGMETPGIVRQPGLAVV